MLPPELDTSPPRKIDPSLFVKNKKNITSILIAAIAIIPLVGFLFYIKFGDFTTGIYFGIGLGLFMSLFAFALNVNMNRSIKLLRDGIAVLGTIDTLNAPADRGGNAYIVMKIKYTDKIGLKYAGNVVLLGKNNEVNKKAGDEIPVLYLPNDPTSFAVSTGGLGIASGKAKKE